MKIIRPEKLVVTTNKQNSGREKEANNVLGNQEFIYNLLDSEINYSGRFVEPVESTPHRHPTS
jgi:hypothetical protein